MGREKVGACETIDSGGGCFQDHGMNDMDYVLRQWDVGERHLAAGRYVAAQRMLEAAERGAWEARDWVRLARIYLPLLEARRQIRQNAAEGTIVITSVGDRGRMRGVVRAFAKEEAGTLLLDVARAEVGVRWAREVRYAALRTGHLIEAMLLLRQGGEVRMVSPGDAEFAAGLSVEWTADEGRMIGVSTERGLVVPLPAAGRYGSAGRGSGLHAVARESLIAGWEALALKWQARHTVRAEAEEELGWLRRALEVDPACEPVAMRLMALAEAVGRRGK